MRVFGRSVLAMVHTQLEWRRAATNLSSVTVGVNAAIRPSVAFINRERRYTAIFWVALAQPPLAITQ